MEGRSEAGGCGQDSVNSEFINNLRSFEEVSGRARGERPGRA